jgi:hypothetical protein
MTEDHAYIDSDGAEYRGKQRMHGSVPAAWRAKISGDKFLEWRVYVNVEPIVKVVTEARR